MPTERFYRLPDAKRQVIRDAAIHEFARVPFEKASINQIIYSAEISRGSFYTYFEDKQDLVKYIFEDVGRKIQTFCDETLKANGGDYIDLLSSLFEHSICSLKHTTIMMDVVKNVFSYEQNTQLLGLNCVPKPGGLKQDQEQETICWVYRRIDKSLLRCQEIEDFFPLMMLGVSSILLALKQYYEYPDCLDEIRETLQKTFDLLRNGAYNTHKERRAFLEV